VPGTIEAATSLVARQAPSGKPRADALGHGHDVGLDAGPFMGEELARPAVAALHFVEDQQHAVLVAERAQAAHEFGRHGGAAALALHGLDEDGAGLRRDRRLDQLQIARCDMLEAGERRAEALDIVGVASRGDHAHGPAVERAGEGDDLVAIFLPLAQK
jgi:hypothetical protein